MSNISADFVLRHLLARIEWAAGRGAEYVIDAYDQELIRKALGETSLPIPPKSLDGPSVSYYYLMDGDTVLEGDEVLCNDMWKSVWEWLVGEKKPNIFLVRRPIHASSPDGYRMLVPGEIVSLGDEVLFSDGWHPASGFVLGCEVTGGSPARRPVTSTIPDGYEYLGDDDFILTSDEMSECGGPWRKVDVLMGGKVKRCPHIRYRRRVSAPPIPAADNYPSDSTQYYYLVRGDRIEEGDQVYTKSGWVDCHLVGCRRILADIRRPLVGCPFPGRDYKVFPKGYFVGKELKEGDAAWDGHNWLRLQSVLDNQGYLDVVLKNNFVRRKKIHL